MASAGESEAVSIAGAFLEVRSTLAAVTLLNGTNFRVPTNDETSRPRTAENRAG